MQMTPQTMTQNQAHSQQVRSLPILVRETQSHRIESPQRQAEDRGMSPPDRKRMRRNSGSAAASPYGVQPETPHQQSTPHQGSLPFNQAMSVQTQNQNMAQASLQAQQHAQQMQQQQMMQAHMAHNQQSQPPTPQSVAGQNDDQVSRARLRLPRRNGLTIRLIY